MGAAGVTGRRETTRYATPALTYRLNCWFVTAHPYGERVGFVEQRESCWRAVKQNGWYYGLWPTKQAAAEVLVKQAGYELELT